MTADCILAIDQGTTSSRALVYDRALRVIGQAQEEVAPTYPRSGWVEHDSGKLHESVRRVVDAAIASSGRPAKAIGAIGLTNQRETAILWDRKTGVAVGPAIVWQDRRTAPFCESRAGHQAWISDRTGLVLDAYFSATKFAWLLDHVAGLRHRAEAGEIAAGTVDSWLIWHLTGGARHVTDVTNASRTLLMDLNSAAWADDLCGFFAVPMRILPEIVQSSTLIGETRGFGCLPDGIPIRGVAGDQQASLIGQGCVAPGDAKCTYGTGAFLLVHTGEAIPRSSHGLVATAAASFDGAAPNYALEGSVFVAGAAVQWFRDGLRAIGAAPEIDVLYDQGRSDSGVVFVPALTGLGAPHWHPDARGTIFGLSRDTSVADLARATIEGVAFQVGDLIDAVRADAPTPPRELRVDGGMARSDPFLQFQADLLGIPLRRSPHTESTALGAALLAGVAAGFWPNIHDALGLLASGTQVFEPRQGERWRAAALGRWREAIESVKRYYGPTTI